MSTHILIPDVHAPFHSRPATTLACKVIQHVQPDGVTQVGDFVDHESVSPHGRKRENLTLTIKRECQIGLEVAADFRAAGKRTTKYRFLKGNHELWWPRYLDKHPEMADQEGCDFGKMMAANGWEVFEYGTSCQLGPYLAITHDFGRAGKTSVFQGANVMGSSVAYGHTHGASLAYSATLSGQQRLCANLGWLGDPKHARYRQDQLKQIEWTWGVGLVHLSKRGWFHLSYLPFFEADGVLATCVEGKWLTVKL